MPEPVEDGAALKERRRVLTRLATSSMPYDPPLPPTHPLVVFCARWNRAGGFANQDRATLARLVEAGEKWAADLGLAEELETIRRRCAAQRERR